MYVQGVTEVEVKSTEEAYAMFWKGTHLYNTLTFFSETASIYYIGKVLLFIACVPVHCRG